MAGNLTAMMASIFSGGVTADPYYEYTTLLLPGSGTNGAQNNTFLDGSTNNFTITRNGNTTQGTFSPFSQTGWGNYFNGSSAFGTSDVATDFQSGDFTIEAWVYLSSLSTVAPVVTGFNTSVGLQITTSAELEFFQWTGSAYSINIRSSVSAVALNTWVHVVGVRSGSNASVYVNGSRLATSTTVSGTQVSTGSTLVGRNSVSTRWVSGYISNLRIVKGTAVYDPTQTTLTVPTSPLTAITNTSLLTCQSNRFIDKSSNNFTITVNGNTSVVAFSPFNPTASWSAAANGGSGYFDGSGDYLSVPDNAALRFGTGDFCFETWVYLTALPASFGDLICKGTNNAGTFEISVISTGKLGFYTTVSVFQSVAALTVNQWFHVALTRSGTTLRLFINGVLDTTVTSFTTDFNNTGSLLAGAFGSGTGNNLSGYLSSYRCVKGDPVYTSNFTPPTAPLTAITNTSLLLNFTNAGIYDATSKNDLETVDGAQISNAITPKWGSTSIKFDGTGDSLITSPSIVNSIGTGDFTIEFWCYPSNTTAAYRAIVASENYNSTAGGWSIYQNGTGIEIYLTSGAIVTAASQLVASTWQHIALVRSGSASNNCKLYVNGTNVASATNTADWTGQRIFIGDNNYPGTDYFFNGYIQDLRITKGYARYVAGTGANAGKMVFNGTNDLALPTAAFPTL